MSTNNDYDFIFNWRIKNYSSSFQKVGECIESPEFTVGKLHFSKWKIQLYPNGYSQNYDQYVSLTFTRNDDEILGKFYIDEKVELLTADGIILKSSTWSNIECNARETLVAFTFLLKSTLKSKFSILSDDTISIRYFLRKCRKFEEFPTSCDAESNIDVDTCCFKWLIKYTDDESLSQHICIPFPTVSPLKVYLTSSNDSILINICKSNDQCNLVNHVRCKISLLYINNVEQISEDDNYIFSESHKTWLFPTFINKTILKENVNLVDGFFTIMCKISSSNGALSKRIIKYGYNNVYNHLHLQKDNNFNRLSDDLSNLYQSEKHADVKLQLNNKIFPAHRSILVARAPVFSTMFDQDMTESKTGIVNLEGIDENILSNFLRFLYTETFHEINHEIALKLLLVADKYQVQSLNQKCSLYLKSNFTELNVCEILLVADMIRHEELKDYAIDYIKNHSRQILPSPEWLQCIEKNIKLGIEVLSKLSTEFGT